MGRSELTASEYSASLHASSVLQLLSQGGKNTLHHFSLLHCQPFFFNLVLTPQFMKNIGSAVLYKVALNSAFPHASSLPSVLVYSFVLGVL